MRVRLSPLGVASLGLAILFLAPACVPESKKSGKGGNGGTAAGGGGGGGRGGGGGGVPIIKFDAAPTDHVPPDVEEEKEDVAPSMDCGAPPGSDAAPMNPTFANVRAIIEAAFCGSNGSCHDRTEREGELMLGEKGTNVPQTNAEFHAQLTGPALGVDHNNNNAPICKDKGMRVVPGNPDASILIQKIDTRMTPTCGSRMPRGAPYCFQQIPIRDVNTIRAWVAAGAPM